MADVRQLEKFLQEERQECVSAAMALISEDAPKNKFSILAGRLREIENVEAKIASMKREEEPKG